MPDTAYQTLLDRILLGDYAPGATLGEREVAQELGFSRTPVREALLRLKLEGLVRIIPRGGIFVAEVSLQKVREITEVRLVLEEYLGKLAAKRRTPEILREYRDWLQKLEPVWDRLSPRDWVQKDTEFHRLLDRAALNDCLSAQLGLLRRQAALFWGRSAEGRWSLRCIIDDFREVLVALEHGNTERCVRALHQHVLNNLEYLQNWMRSGQARCK